MGDRAQIAIKQFDGSKVYLYSHWGGSELNDTLRTALKRGRSRWQDSEYLGRIIFCDMVRGQLDETSGIGIGTERHEDVEHPIPVLDCQTMTISWEGLQKEPCSFEHFISQ